MICLVYLEQGEKLKRQASDAGERVKSAAQNAKKQTEEQGEGLLDKVFSVLSDVKDSLLGKHFLNQNILQKKKFSSLEKVGIASKHVADLTDQAKDKLDEVSGKAQKTATKVKKDVKDGLDL
jgi:hypothetical protein